MRGKFLLWLFALAIFAGCTARADNWPAAQVKEVFSKSREWFVRVVPGESLGDTFGFAGSTKGAYARAEFYRRQQGRSYRLVQEIRLLNPVAPVLFFVTDRGYLTTLDNWHNMGYGKVVASYSPQGRLVSSYELKALFSAEEIQQFQHSVSSIWWRKDTAYVRSGQHSVYVVVDENGRELIFEPETGDWQYCSWRGDEHLCRNTNGGRTWKPYQEPQLPIED